jgi:hypothetical protein
MDKIQRLSHEMLGFGILGRCGGASCGFFGGGIFNVLGRIRGYRFGRRLGLKVIFQYRI